MAIRAIRALEIEMVCQSTGKEIRAPVKVIDWRLDGVAILALEMVMGWRQDPIRVPAKVMDWSSDVIRAPVKMIELRRDLTQTPTKKMRLRGNPIRTPTKKICLGRNRGYRHWDPV